MLIQLKNFAENNFEKKLIEMLKKTEISRSFIFQFSKTIGIRSLWGLVYLFDQCWENLKSQNLKIIF